MEDIQTVLIKNTETTVTVMDALFAGVNKKRLMAGMRFADSVLSAARQVRITDQSDLTRLASSLFYLFEKYTDGDVKKLKSRMGYRLGDIGVRRSFEPEFDSDGGRDGYFRGCGWITSDGLMITPESDPFTSQGLYIENPMIAARQGSIMCLAPGFTGGAPSEMDADEIREHWTRNVSSTFFPLMADIAPSDISFKNDWAYSKTDVFTMTLMTVFTNVLAKAASSNLDSLDWIIYRIYAGISEQERDPERYRGSGVWNPVAWTKNLLFPGDLEAVAQAAGNHEIYLPEDFMFLLSPMNEILAEAFIKRVEQFTAEEKRSGKKTDKKNEISKNKLRDAAVARDSVLGYWKYLTGVGAIAQSQTAEQKFERFFMNMEEKDYRVLEEIRKDIGKFRKSPVYISKAKNKKEFYIKNALTVPKSFIQWLKEGRDLGALADGIAGSISPEYEFLKEFALSEKLKMSGRDI